MSDSEFNVFMEDEYADGPVDRDTLISEIVELYPEAVHVLAEHGMHCIGCAASSMETLSEACYVHGMNPVKVRKALNRVIMGGKDKPEERLTFAGKKEKA